MATTGTRTFDPQIAQIMEDAFERAGVALSGVGSDHVNSALRSLRLMLQSEWSGVGELPFMVAQLTQTTAAAMESFALPAGVLDVLEVVLRRDGMDTPMQRVDRADYLAIPDKSKTGRPDRFYVERLAGLSAKTAYIWPAGENATDTIVMNALRVVEDPGALSNTVQLPLEAMEAAAAGLAARLALKFNPERYALLQLAYRGQEPTGAGGALKTMREALRSRADLEFSLGGSL